MTKEKYQAPTRMGEQEITTPIIMTTTGYIQLALTSVVDTIIFVPSAMMFQDRKFFFAGRNIASGVNGNKHLTLNIINNQLEADHQEEIYQSDLLIPLEQKILYVAISALESNDVGVRSLIEAVKATAEMGAGFLHGLRNSLLATVLSAVESTDDANEFVNTLRSVFHTNSLGFLSDPNDGAMFKNVIEFLDFQGGEESPFMMKVVVDNTIVEVQFENDHTKEFEVGCMFPLSSKGFYTAVTIFHTFLFNATEEDNDVNDK